MANRPRRHALPLTVAQDAGCKVTCLPGLAMRWIADLVDQVTLPTAKLATELGLRTSAHVESDGTRRPTADLLEHGLLRDTSTFMQASATTSCGCSPTPVVRCRSTRTSS